MVSAFAVLAPLVAGVATLIIVLVRTPSRRRHVAIDEPTYPGLRALRSKTTTARVAGLILALGAAWAVANWRHPWTQGGRGLMLAPVASGTVLLVAIAVGELLARGDARSRSARHASVTAAGAERARLPRGLAGAVAGMVAALVTLIMVGWALGLSDTTGDRPGSSIEWASSDGVFTGGAGPWPGAYYGRPALAALVVLLTISVSTLLLVRRRPQDAADPEIRRVDAVIRRRQIESVVAATGLSVTTLTCGFAIAASSSLSALRAGARLNGYDPGVWYSVGGWCALVTGLAALAVGIWCAVSLLTPGPATFRGPRSAAVTGRAIPA